MRMISARRAARARVAVAISLAGAACAAAAFVPAWQYMSEIASQTGFADYVSLAISDGASLAGAWQVMLLSLAESAPLLGWALIVAVAMVFSYCVRRLVRDIALIRSPLTINASLS